MHDMHVHTLRSADSGEVIPAYIQKAGEIGVNTICFTDHVDVNPHDMGYEYFDPEKYWTDYERSLEQAGAVKLLSGMEFGEPYLYPREFKALCGQPFDFIIGSVHYPEKYSHLFFSELITGGIPAEDCYESYWDSVHNCVAAGGFDCLGHLDIPKRYYKTLIYDENKLREILHIACENGIILEVNTSSLRRGVDTTMPGPELLEIYRSEGGKFAVIGSDAHRASELGANYSEAKTLLDRCGLIEVTFSKRKMIEVDV